MIILKKIQPSKHPKLGNNFDSLHLVLYKTQQVRDSLVARISACHAGDPGSIPGLGDSLFIGVFMMTTNWKSVNNLLA